MSSKRQVNHVSRACDRCRQRKRRCNGERPVCNACLQTGASCVYAEEDRRKDRPHDELAHLRSRISSLEALVLDHLSTAHSIDPQVAQTMLERSRPARIKSETGEPDTDAQPSLFMGTGNHSPDLPWEGSSSIFPAPAPMSARKTSQDEKALSHHGPSALWTHARPELWARSVPLSSQTTPGAPVDWARYLPKSVPINRTMHDRAIQHFESFYAPWCMIVDIPAFLREMATINAETSTAATAFPIIRTPNYSPLLHNCVVYMGMYLLRDEWPDVMKTFEAVFAPHCSVYIRQETESPTLSTVRALNLLSTCQGLSTEMKSISTTGYIHFGMTFAATVNLGLNIECEPMVKKGLLTPEEKDLRESLYWTVFNQDILRSIGGGRPPMLPSTSEMPHPKIDAEMDAVPWMSPVNPATMDPLGRRISGAMGLRSTIFYQTSKLTLLLKRTMAIGYSTREDDQDRPKAEAELAADLEKWRNELLLPDPTACPLPHLLMLHMLYHLTVIFLHRPSYRKPSTITPTAAERCDAAAHSTLQLLRTFDETHGVRHGPMTLIQYTLAAATVFALRALSSPTSPGSQANVSQRLQDCIGFMSRIAYTWNEGTRGLDVLISLCNEWLPGVQSSGSTLHPETMPQWPESAKGSPLDLNEWLMSQEQLDLFWNPMTSEMGMDGAL